eukprot:TRINITY_DN44020_c0_g1_i1.p1 TRINITY_DN44020_c0_g1~~TRINITY_DN44020_c0_g1_i1.p1  ORF type:complete len:143 (-),score=12.85 TRINITY_DN44020_c0_g1_i1:85-513(-)
MSGEHSPALDQKEGVLDLTVHLLSGDSTPVKGVDAGKSVRDLLVHVLKPKKIYDWECWVVTTCDGTILDLGTAVGDCIKTGDTLSFVHHSGKEVTRGSGMYSTSGPVRLSACRKCGEIARQDTPGYYDTWHCRACGDFGYSR